MADEPNNQDSTPIPAAPDPGSSSSLEADVKAWVEKLEGRLKDWGLDVERMQERASAASTDVRAEINKDIDVLKAEMEKARGRLDELRKSGTDASGELLKGVESAWNEIRKGVDNAYKKLR